MSVISDKLLRLARVVSDTADAVAVHELDGRITAWNHGAESLYGYSEEEALKLNVRDLVPVDERTNALDYVRPLLQGDTTAPFEAQRVAKDGRMFHVLVTATILTDEQGVTVAVGTIERDFTEWKQRETQLRQREGNLLAILENAVEAIITIDTRGIVESFNPAAERLFGYTRDEILGRNVSILMPAPYQNEHDAYIANYLRTGVRKIIGIGREVVGLRKDRTTFPIHLSVSQVSEGRDFFVGMIRDLSEQKQHEAMLLQAERLSAIGQAMTGLTHESRNALARSQANLRRLSRRLGDRPELVEFINGALRAQDEVGRLFDEVRQYAAPLVLDRQPCRLDELLSEAWNQLSNERAERVTNLRIVTPNVDCTCSLDRFTVRNALRNILQNSLAACSDPVELTATFMETINSGAPAIQLMLCDNGPGLAPDVRVKVFDAFFTTKTHGTGLGLAIVKRTVEAHGGMVSAKSEPGKGANFTLIFPRNYE